MASPMTLEQLGIAVERGHHAVDDRCHVVEPDLEERLRLDSLDVESDASEVDVDAHCELHEVEHVCLEGHVRVEVVELEMKTVDLDDRNVQEDVGKVVVELPGVLLGVVLVLALGRGTDALDVLCEPVLLDLL